MKTEDFIKEYKTIILEFINNNDFSTHLKIPRVALSVFYDILKPIGFHEDNFETNGWETDFWLTYTNDKYYIIISGDLYYKNEYSIRLSETRI